MIMIRISTDTNYYFREISFHMLLLRSSFVAAAISGIHLLCLGLDHVMAQDCSVNSTCPEGEFCNYDCGSSGFCEGCPGFSSPCSDLGLPSGGVDDCYSVCTQDCSVNSACPEGEFCNYDFGSSGTCEGCPGFSSPCSELGLPSGGVDDCESVCRQDCSVNSTCSEGEFCNYAFGSSGFCEGCPEIYISSCSNRGIPSGGVDDCESVCHTEELMVSSPFEVFPVDAAEGGCEVPEEKYSEMMSQGFTKVACPFGVLVAGTEGYSDAGLKFAANVIANILDQDSDGVADNPDLVQVLTYRGKPRGGALLQCGVSPEEEERGDELRNVFDYAYSCQTWKADDLQEFQGIMMEEAFHLVHQSGYAEIYPDELGMDDYTSSIVGRETARLQCVQPGWIFPDNVCPADSPRQPGNPAPSPLPGTCSYPSCDVAEFYKMVLFLAIGMGEENDPGGPLVWMSDYMPGRQDDVLAMLSTEFKEMINNSSLRQLSAPLTGEYDAIPPTPTTPTPTTPTPTPGPTSSARSTRLLRNLIIFGTSLLIGISL